MKNRVKRKIGLKEKSIKKRKLIAQSIFSCYLMQKFVLTYIDDDDAVHFRCLSAAEIFPATASNATNRNSFRNRAISFVNFSPDRL